MPGAAALSRLAAPAGLSQEERQAQYQRKEEVRQRLTQARHDAALAALTSGDPARIPQGAVAAQSYFGTKSRRGLTEDDLPFLEALLTAPALLRFLDAREADGEREKGFETIYKGLCLMGPDGVPFLDDVKQRLSRSPYSPREQVREVSRSDGA